MQLTAAALEHHCADIAVRERFSFSERRIRELLPLIKAQAGAEGAVLLSTCSRTELYLVSENPVSPELLLCTAAGIDPADCSGCFLTLEGEDAVRHLMEVACGLRSMILCEDQIITQVKNAALVAREEKTQSPVLETVFRLAVTAAKKAKTEIQVHAVPRSSAERAVELLREHLNGLKKRRVMVIGNGEMGRICASLLSEAGCRTTVTLRTYRHGETVVPFGCEAIPYDHRTELLDKCDAVVSATVSPHYTLTADMFEHLAHKPAILIDLAMPRDIDPALEQAIPCLNIDHMVTTAEQQAENLGAVSHIHAIIDEHMELYRQWLTIHEGADAIARIKDRLTDKVSRSLARPDEQELIEAAVVKTVDAILFAAREELSPSLIENIQRNLR